MKKRYVISGILIGIVALLIYLQYGREETIVNTRVRMSDDGYVQEISVIANKLFIGDKERYAEDVIDKVIRNQYRNVYFSYNILGRPEEIKINFYLEKWDYRYNQKNFITVYSNENIEGMRWKNIWNNKNLLRFITSVIDFNKFSLKQK